VNILAAASRRCHSAEDSPERVLETGLLMEGPEKNRWSWGISALRLFSLVRLVGKIPRKRPPFSHILAPMQQNLSAVETAWRREVNSNSRYCDFQLESSAATISVSLDFQHR
jgi:hypothetical protein